MRTRIARTSKETNGITKAKKTPRHEGQGKKKAPAIVIEAAEQRPQLEDMSEIPSMDSFESQPFQHELTACQIENIWYGSPITFGPTFTEALTTGTIVDLGPLSMLQYNDC